MKKILLLGSQHGDELLGEALYNYIKTRRQELLPHVTYVVGNIRAKKLGVRYIEADLNRSYNGKNTTYEERRAKQILTRIASQKFDLVLDLHTTTTDMPACLIVAPNNAAAEFMRACHVDKVVVMHSDIVNGSLIGNCKQAVSIELNRDAATQTCLDLLCDDILRYLEGSEQSAVKTLYDVHELIEKKSISTLAASRLINFAKSSEGFYPILVGENSYKKQTNYLGFKSYEAKRTKI